MMKTIPHRQKSSNVQSENTTHRQKIQCPIRKYNTSSEDPMSNLKIQHIVKRVPMSNQKIQHIVRRVPMSNQKIQHIVRRVPMSNHTTDNQSVIWFIFIDSIFPIRNMIRYMMRAPDFNLRLFGGV